MIDVHREWPVFTRIRALRLVTNVPIMPVINPPQIQSSYYIACPFQPDADHYATIHLRHGEALSTPPWGRTGLRVIHCVCCEKHAWGEFESFSEQGDKLVPSKAILDVLKMEEETFRKLLEKFKHIAPCSIPPEEAVVLWHTHGCPEEIAAEASTDYRMFYELVEQHKAKGSGGKPKKGAYSG